VVFTGGEPTVHPNLLECIEYAKAVGYQEIQIQSNGRNFSDIVYLQKLINAGVTEFSPSIHGFHSKTHDALVGSP
jgi:MoaA/NifB/PqqE/SkfB family radical SAM enzyme